MARDQLDRERRRMIARHHSQVPNARTRQASGEKWVRPVDAPISTPFGISGPHWESTHDGVDFAAAEGTPIRAATAGRVVSVGWAGAYGIRTVIRHAPGLETWYCHQSDTAVVKRQEVSAGQVIGSVGETGNTTGPHLHFMVVSDGVKVDPTDYLRGAVDLPGSATDPGGSAVGLGGSSVADGLGLDASADTLRRLILTIALVGAGVGIVALAVGRASAPLRSSVQSTAADIATTVIPAGRGAKAAAAAGAVKGSA